MIKLESYAYRTFRLRGRRGAEVEFHQHYYSFAHGRRPAWWSDDIPCANKAFAVYENHLGSSCQAIVFSEEQLTVLGGDAATVVRFDDVEDVDLPVKDPVSLSLKIRLRSAAMVELPASNPVGISFSMFIFLRHALRHARKRMESL